MFDIPKMLCYSLEFVWCLFKQIIEKKQGLNGWVILRSLNISLGFDEWIAQTAIFGRAKSERCSKVHDFQYPFVIFVKFLGCV